MVTHPDYFCPTDEGPEPDCGAFAKVIELATKKLPVAVLGKPHPSMIEEAVRRSRVNKKDMVLIGDRLMTDIAMGKQAGIDTVLVLTGESTRRDLKNSKFKPKLVVPSVKSL
jgi:NagD protein